MERHLWTDVVGPRAFVYSILLMQRTVSVAYGYLATVPMETVAVVGQTVQLNCSTSDSYFVLWEHTPVGAPSYEYVFFSKRLVKPYSQRYTITGNSTVGEYHLVISDVQLGDAGKYGCVDRAGHGERKEAELIVLGSYPACESPVEVIGDNSCGIEREKAKVRCSLDYSGNRCPVIECGTKDRRSPTASANATTVARGKATYDMELDYDPMNLRNCPLLCRTQSSNIHSNDFFVQVLSISISSNSEVTIRSSETVNCFVECSQPCRYKWTQEFNETEIATGQNLYISAPGRYRCIAECSLRGQVCTVSPMIVEFFKTKEDHESEGSETSVMWTTLMLLGVVPVIAIVLVIVVLKSKKQESKKREKLQSDLESTDDTSMPIQEKKMTGTSSGNMNQLDRRLPSSSDSEQSHGSNSSESPLISYVH